MQYALIPIISALTPFLFLPVLARLAGVDAWVAIAVGQSVGGFGALIVSLGLNVVGPTVVSPAQPSGRIKYLQTSTLARVLILIPVQVAAMSVAGVLAPHSEVLLAAIAAVAAVLTGLTFSWYFIGINRPLQLVLVELAPKVVATGIAVVLLFATREAFWYPLLLLLLTVMSYAFFLIRETRGEPWEVKGVIPFIRQQWTPATSEVAGGAYTSLTISLVTAVTVPAQTAIFVSGDKLYRLGQSVIGLTGNFLQARVVAAGPNAVARRAQQALAVHTAMGLAAFIAFCVLGPMLTTFFFGPKVALDRVTSVALGVAVFALCINTSLGRQVLLSYRAHRTFMASVVCGAIVGVPTIVLLASSFGAAGAAWAVAASELTVLIVQVIGIIVLRPIWRKRGAQMTSL